MTYLLCDKNHLHKLFIHDFWQTGLVFGDLLGYLVSTGPFVVCLCVSISKTNNNTPLALLTSAQWG